MDLFEKRILIMSLTLLLFFFILVVYAATGLGADVPTCLPEAQPPEKGELIQLGDKRYQLNLVARMWTFEPNEIRIPAGSTVDIYVTSRDVVHGFHVERTLVNLMAIPGVVSYRRVTFDRPGEYLFVCHEFCGIAHHTMAGKIIVE
ncbi:MAG: cytochrome c oxidase subunit II [candidate division WOR-3 bacterium]